MNTLADQFEDDFGSAFGDLAKAVATTAAQNAAHVQTCPKCSGRGVFVSYSGRVLGDCFACKGKGTQSFKTSPAARAQSRAKVADRKADKATQALADFAAQHPAEAAWIEASRATFGFAQSIHEAIQKFGSLTANQLAACSRAVAKQAASQAARVVSQANAPVVQTSALHEAFSSASRAIKSPKLRLTDGLVISPAKASSANAGALYVKADGTYIGKIVADGRFLRSRDCDDAAEAKIVAIAADPLGAAKVYGQQTGACSCCGRTLTDPVSIELGIGPICAERFGW